ncbi:male sterility protein-domain-containing protein [Polychytrium aggregatum]|uniref:male sterility protein-domain-containing protein n=1 Tax=Polychytrium aggregatum TaxID=110093 RepID=UPI0022FE3980|nr:male sterility protein-domain-containing protein [Polychytrium aggregatum]KAI9197044.1 male sterility protein-domain-containing protein [Polychytrium aggregatum]
MVFKILSCCFGEGSAQADALSVPSRGAAASPMLIQPQRPPPMDPFGPWVHPLETVIQMAKDEPDALAILTNESDVLEKFSYLQLWNRSYSIAQALKALPDWDDPGHDTVALFCEPEAHWVIYSFALWILGKKMIAFGLNWPATARKSLCQRLNIKYVLYRLNKPGRIEGLQPIDAASLAFEGVVPTPSTSACESFDEYIGYLSTSGTTGIPKTYQVSHRFCQTSRPAVGVPYGSIAVFQAPSFSASMASLVLVFNTKGSVWFPKPTPNPMDKARSVIGLLDRGLDIVISPPSFVKMVFNVASTKDKTPCWDKTKRVNFASELIPISVVHRARKLCPNAIIRCSYGSSETSVINAVSSCIIQPSEETPSQLVYKLLKPGVRCLLFDEEGNTVDQRVSCSGILVLAVDKDDPIKNHPNFANSDPNDKLASFGFLEDGSPRVCTMDWVEMKGDREFTVIGRFGQKIKVNGVYVDLNALEELANQHMGGVLADCALVQTSEKKIVMLYVPRKGSNPVLSPGEILQMTEDLFALKNVAKFPIHNCFELSEVPFNESGKRDLKKLKRIAERADHYGMSVSYPILDVNRTALSRIATKISRLGSQILDIEALDGRNYYIGGVGFDSLSVGRLALAIKDEFSVEISPLILLSNGMTPTDVAQLVVDILDNKPLIPPTVHLAAEAAKLDDASVTAEGLPPFVYPKDPRGIVLTGATGFLGAFLIFELAHKFPQAKIYCLVRAPTEQVAVERIISTAQKLVLDPSQRAFLDHNLKSRLVGLCGNLSQDKWGLSDERWKEISEETDMIVHNGAEVHWLYDYERLKGPNVLSTATALQLATTHHLKVLHYISTIGTIPMAKKADKPLEEKIYSAWNISGGYGQTKWVSEQLVNKARSRGVPVTIIRPAGIVGDSQYGVSNSDDYIWRYVKGCIQLGIAPSHATPVTMTMDPVDHVAKVVAEIAGSEEALSKFVFHVSDSEYSVITETKLFEIVNAHGWRVLFETREQFKTLLVENTSLETNALFPLMHIMMDMSFKIDNRNTQAIYPTPSPRAVQVTRKCLSYLYHAKFLPAPQNPSSDIKEEEFPEVSIFGRTGRH